MIIEELNSDKTPLQNVKQRFFALRNGMLADMLRKSGSPYHIIFGLNLPQIREVAAAMGTDPELAEALWNNSSTRESRLMAPMVADRARFTADDARRWLEGLSGSAEEVDVLCHSLLRHLPEAEKLAAEMADDERGIKRYAALRLMFGRVAVQPRDARIMAERELERNDALTRGVARQLIDEADFILGEDGN